LYWDNVGERQRLGPKLIQDTRDKVHVIKKRMSVAQSWQKSYADSRKRPSEFEMGDHVFLKVSPMRRLMRFGKKGKLSPRFVGSFEITERVGRLAYRIALPIYLVGMHDVFHVSMLRKYIANPNVIVEYEPLEIHEGLTYVEESVKIVEKRSRFCIPRRFLSSRYCGAIMELRKHRRKQSTTCRATTHICLNDCV
jgi:hypothetical protein